MRKPGLALVLLLGLASAQAQVPQGWPPPAGTVANLCIYNSSVPVPTSGSPFFLQCDVNGNLRIGTVTLGAGSAVIGKVGIDQTTPGVTNGIAIAPSSATGVAITPSATQAAASSSVFKASPGNLYSLDVTIGATTGWVMVFDATSPPGNGATGASLKWCWPVNSNGTLGGMSRVWNPPLLFATGITVGFSSTACNSLTASATAFFYGQVQ